MSKKISLKSGKKKKGAAKGGFEHSTEVDWHISGQDDAILGTFGRTTHVPGRSVTRHRSVEWGRAQAALEGQHAEHGKFAPEFAFTGEDQSVFRAPSGESVTIKHSKDSQACPDDRLCEVNGQAMYHGQARAYLKHTRGIHI